MTQNLVSEINVDDLNSGWSPSSWWTALHVMVHKNSGSSEETIIKIIDDLISTGPHLRQFFSIWSTERDDFYAGYEPTSQFGTPLIIATDHYKLKVLEFLVSDKFLELYNFDNLTKLISMLAAQQCHDSLPALFATKVVQNLFISLSDDGEICFIESCISQFGYYSKAKRIMQQCFLSRPYSSKYLMSLIKRDTYRKFFAFDFDDYLKITEEISVSELEWMSKSVAN